MSGASLERASRRLLEHQWFASSVALLLLISGLVLGWQWEARENAAQVRQVSGQARILAGSLAGALAFDDEATAREYIAALRRDPSIKAAAVYDEDGRLVVGMNRDSDQLPSRISERPPQISGGTLTIVQPVREDSLDLGHVYLKTSIEPMSDRISRYVAVGLVVVLAALLIALLGAANAAAARGHRQLREEVIAREQAEGALRQAQKMEALGQLTGGVAHDFNNLLMAASSGLELLDRAKSDERREMLKGAIRDALERGARITEQLLAFSRRRPVKSEIVELPKHIGTMASLLDHSLRENIDVRFKIDDDLWPIEVDAAQFDIAILNLGVNAKDAMPHGGELCITANNQPGALDGQDAVQICIHDEGCGMSADVLERAFEPFFTSKEVGKGTGLGLSQVYGFARGGGGAVTIDSTPGEGTVVTLILPRAAVTAAAQASPAAVAPSDLNGWRILLVEDDPNLNALIGQMLEDRGAEVERAFSGAEGLLAFEPARIDAVVSDMVMPGEIGGLELVREIRARKADVAVVLMTGYSEAAGTATDEGFPLLRKPFNSTDLIDLLNHSISR